MKKIAAEPFRDIDFSRAKRGRVLPPEPGSRTRYDEIGVGYSAQRRADPRILQYIDVALAGSASVLNVGAGGGSYEPTNVPTIAVEPSFGMIGQRPNQSNVVQGAAEALPFKDASFDSSLAVLTIHHWSDVGQGLRECARSSKRNVVILTWDPDSPAFWLSRDYIPELLVDRRIFPPGLLEGFVDKDLGREGLPHRGGVWAEGTMHIDHALEHNQEPRTMRDLLAYKPALEGQRRIEASPFSKRELIELDDLSDRSRVDGRS